MTTRDAMSEARAAAWTKYHKAMHPARDAFEAVRAPARAKLDAALRDIKPSAARPRSTTVRTARAD